MDFSFAEYRMFVSIVKTQNKPKCSATPLEQWKRPTGRMKERDHSNQNLSPCLANFQYSTKFQLSNLLVGVLHLFCLQANTHLAFLKVKSFRNSSTLDIFWLFSSRSRLTLYLLMWRIWWAWN